jgi:hypothetical protein
MRFPLGGDGLGWRGDERDKTCGQKVVHVSGAEDDSACCRLLEVCATWSPALAKRLDWPSGRKRPGAARDVACLHGLWTSVLGSSPLITGRYQSIVALLSNDEPRPILSPRTARRLLVAPKRDEHDESMDEETCDAQR